MASTMLRRTNIGFVRRINNGYALASVCLTMEASKACTQCGIVKPLSKFHQDQTKKSGRRSACRACENPCARERDRIRRASGAKAAYRRSNPQAYQLAKMVTLSRARAKAKGLAHDIDVGYLRAIAPSHCPYLGVELRWKVQEGLGVKGKAFPNSPSLDRIDSSKGYVRGNVVIVSFRANTIKSNATEQELIEMGRRIAQLKMQLACEDMQ